MIWDKMQSFFGEEVVGPRGSCYLAQFKVIADFDFNVGEFVSLSVLSWSSLGELRIAKRRGKNSFID
jgi:hypothetical protein